MTVMRNDPATLRCSFSGNPPPEVTWYRDGEALEPKGHRLVLPDGALFFLRVTQGRGGRTGGDAGNYWCVARNSLGVARSRNATLTVACKSLSRQIFASLRPIVGFIPSGQVQVVINQLCQSPSCAGRTDLLSS